ncbi:MAG: cyanophycin synthetase, partial [Campylobacterota bacterium]|nr:cyanophycin synthetase [Campylobacterota bacterium]
ALIGAISKEFDSNFRYINDTLAFEADESDGSFVLSHPYCSIVLNTEPEHMEYYDYDERKFYGAYKEFLDIAKLRVINAEDKFLSTYDKFAIKLYPSKDISNIEYFLKDGEPYTRFELKDFGSFEVWGFGEHIALNTSCAILAAKQSMKLVDIKNNLSKYKGIKKRFDIIQKNMSDKNFVVIDDYAHHPTEIKATIKSVNIYKKFTDIKKTTVIWQPHKYSRTIDNLEAFRACFFGCDELIILPVWSVNEEPQNIDFVNLFSYYNITLADKVVTTKGKIEVIKDNSVIKTIDSGIALGVGAGDITYQLRY